MFDVLNKETIDAIISSKRERERELAAFHFLKLSEEHFMNNKWEDSIANSRKYFECVLQEVASLHSKVIRKVELPSSTYEKPVRVREYLERENLLEKKEKEVVSSIYGLLSETGAHPYMAEADQARLLRHLTLTIAQFVMLRLNGMISQKIVDERFVLNILLRF